jgi:hypothetical protein
VQEIARNDFTTIAQASSHRIREHLPIPSSIIASDSFMDDENKGQEQLSFW